MKEEDACEKQAKGGDEEAEELKTRPSPTWQREDEWIRLYIILQRAAPANIRLGGPIWIFRDPNLRNDMLTSSLK